MLYPFDPEELVRPNLGLILETSCWKIFRSTTVYFFPSFLDVTRQTHALEYNSEM